VLPGEAQTTAGLRFYSTKPRTSRVTPPTGHRAGRAALAAFVVLMSVFPGRCCGGVIAQAMSVASSNDQDAFEAWPLSRLSWRKMFWTGPAPGSGRSPQDTDARMRARRRAFRRTDFVAGPALLKRPTLRGKWSFGTIWRDETGRGAPS
jgi:hypothetical protein